MKTKQLAGLLVIALLLGLAACTTTLNHQYKGQADLDSDVDYCEARFVAVAHNPAHFRYLVDRCLRVQGWQ